MAEGRGYTGGSDPGQVFIGDFGRLGLWQWGSRWRIESGADTEGIIAVSIPTSYSGMHIADFGSRGRRGLHRLGGYRCRPSADTNGDGAKEILTDFGASGLWMWDGARAQIGEDNPD